MDNVGESVAEQDTPTPREARVQRIARALILALAVAVGLAAFIGAGVGESPAEAAARPEDAPRLGGDYPAFFGAGSIILDGDLDTLYEEDRQVAAQVGLGLELDGYLAFAYPPHVAAVYAPFAALPYQLSYLLHTAVMAGAYFAALTALSPVVPLIRRWKLPLLAFGFTFYPLSVAIGGGQNAAITVLGFAVIWRALHDDREWLAGVVAGLMMYRPQYALAAIGLLLLSRHWKAVGAAVATTVATWAGTALFLGGAWLTEWFDAVLPFVERDAEVNAANSISALGFLQAALSVDSTPALVLGVAIAGAVTLTLMYLWIHPDKFALSGRMGALAIGSVIISPHANYYDAAVLVIPAVAIVATGDSSKPPLKILGFVWLAFLPLPGIRDLPATPHALYMLLAFVAMVAVTVNPVDQSSDQTGLGSSERDQRAGSHA